MILSVCWRTVSYNVPATLPTTLSGWIASMVALLGENFTNCWIVDEPLGQIVLTVNSADELKDMNCGNLLRYLCMAGGRLHSAPMQ